MTRLHELRADVARDFGRLNYPPPNWPLGVVGPDAKPALDVLIVGAGQFGQTAAFALMRDGVRHMRVIDSAPRGQEGPWDTTARMRTLRSPKHLPGPDLGIPSLTFRAFYEAREGLDGWDALYKIGRRDWVDYLLWLRDVTGVMVENEVTLVALEPAGGLLRARLSSTAGDEVIFARQVILALGRNDATAALPHFPSLPDSAAGHGRVFHAAEPIDFTRFRGGHVAVLGASASAFDNAAVALEAGAAATIFSRRPQLPQVNLTRGMVFAGYLRGFAQLEDAARWDWLTMSADAGTPPPHESVLRCTAHKAFGLHFGTGWTDVAADADGVTVQTEGGVARFDAVVLAMGFTLNLSRLPFMALMAGHALGWADRVSAVASARYPELARFPYLDDGFALTERSLGVCPDLRRVRVIGAAAGASHGVLSGDIPAVQIAAQEVSRSICNALFLEEAGLHRAAIVAFEQPELETTPYFVPRNAR